MGAQGPVFRAQDTVAGQIVAIKALKLDVSPELAPSIAEALRTLVGQAPAVEGLVPLVDAGLEGDTPWLAMEHLACPTLDMRLREGGLLPLDEATALVRALADAIDTAHAHGLDHGSLHPRDVFLPEAGGVIVSGFGVAAAVGVAGIRPPRRRPFTAPETLAQKPLDAPADRYALGVIAYEIVSGRRLLGAGDDLAAGLAARAETSDIPRAATALAAMLAERPEHRPSTATAFAQALCAALESPAAAAETVATTAVIPAPPARPARSAGEPPTPEALAEFARQGTFWEPPRRGVGLHDHVHRDGRAVGHDRHREQHGQPDRGRAIAGIGRRRRQRQRRPQQVPGLDHRGQQHEGTHRHAKAQHRIDPALPALPHDDHRDHRPDQRADRLHDVQRRLGVIAEAEQQPGLAGADPEGGGDGQEGAHGAGRAQCGHPAETRPRPER